MACVEKRNTLAFVIKDSAILQSQNTFFSFAQYLEVMWDLQAFEVLCRQTVRLCRPTIVYDSLSVYSSPWSCLSISSSSCWRFFASSFSFFFARLIHLSVSSVSASASPNVAPFSEALSSCLFFTLCNAQRKPFARLVTAYRPRRW